MVGHWSVQRLWPAIRETAALLGVGEAGLLVGAAAADVAMIAVAAGSVGQAYGRAGRAAGGGFDGMRVPLVSGISSLLVPGWGQILNAQIGKGLFFLVFMHAAAVALAYTLLTPLGEVVSPTVPVVFGVIGAAAMMWVLSVYDAVLVAGTRRRGA